MCPVQMVSAPHYCLKMSLGSFQCRGDREGKQSAHNMHWRGRECLQLPGTSSRVKPAGHIFLVTSPSNVFCTQISNLPFAMTNVLSQKEKDLISIYSSNITLCCYFSVSAEYSLELISPLINVMIFLAMACFF